MKKKPNKQSRRMQLNTLIDIEEIMLRIKLKQASDIFKLQLLASFRPGASLRQMNNQRKLNFG